MDCCEDANMDRVEISVDQTVHFGNCEFPAVYFGNFLPTGAINDFLLFYRPGKNPSENALRAIPLSFLFGK